MSIFNYDVRVYIQKDRETRRKILFEIIFYSMDHIAQQKSWDLQFFENIKKNIIERSYTIYSGYRKTVKKKKSKAQVVVFHDFTFIDVKLNVYTSENTVLKTIEVFKADANAYTLGCFCSKISWLDDNIFRISDSKEEIFIDVAVQEETVTFNFDPKRNTVEALQKHILAIKPDTPEHLRKQYMQA